MTDGKTKTINGLKSKSGKKFDCALKLSPEFKVVLDLPDQGPSETFSTPCPKCKGENTLHVNDIKLWCSTCDFVVWKEKSKYVLTNDELQALCQNGKTAEISDFVSKKGTTYKAFVVLDKDCKAVMELSKRELAPLPYACPKCHSQGTVNIDGGFIASVAEGCGWKVWKEPFQHALTDEELEQLFTNGKTEVIKGLKGKKNTFDSALTWSEDFSITFVRSESSSTPVAKACPKCGQEETLNRSGRKIECPCGFSLWTEINGHPLTDDEINCLLDKKQTRLISGFKKKSGGTFSAYLKLSPACDKVEYVFENKK